MTTIGKTFPLDLRSMKIDPDLIDSVIKITSSTGVTNRADPTQWQRYTVRVLEGHPIFNITIDITEFFGVITANVYVHGVEVMFISDAINAEFYPAIKDAFDKLFDAFNPEPCCPHCYDDDLDEFYEPEAPDEPDEMPAQYK